MIQIGGVERLGALGTPDVHARLQDLQLQVLVKAPIA
jgi:hypothetical protein